MKKIKIEDFLKSFRKNLTEISEGCETIGVDRKIVSSGSGPLKRKQVQVRITKKCSLNEKNIKD